MGATQIPQTEIKEMTPERMSQVIQEEEKSLDLLFWMVFLRRFCN
jgi:hypothetical protein